VSLIGFQLSHFYGVAGRYNYAGTLMLKMESKNNMIITTEGKL
jgi:hypothetical protein